MGMVESRSSPPKLQWRDSRRVATNEVGEEFNGPILGGSYAQFD